MKYDTGTGWVQRWFAKPLVKGSIPSRVSIHTSWTDKPKLNHFKGMQVKFWLGRRMAVWVLHAPTGYHSFRSGLLYDIETTHALSPPMLSRIKKAKSIAELEAQVDRYKAEMIAAKRTISQMKRSQH